MGNPVVHFEIGVTDAARARDFYSRLFGWQVDLDPSGYGMVRTGSEDGIAGGIMPAPEGRPPWVTFYVGVDDLDEQLARAEELGGSRIVDPMPVGGTGAFAMIADPDGNVLGLFAERGAVEAGDGGEPSSRTAPARRGTTANRTSS